MSLSTWLISFSMMPSTSIHVVANGKISSFLLWLSNILFLYIPHFLYSFIWPWTIRLLLYLVYYNSAAMNAGVHVSFGINFWVGFFFLDKYPGVELLGHIVVLGHMASLTQWTWVWANSGRQWRMGKPGLLQFMGSQRVRQELVTEQWQQ